jgi:ribosomal protein S12 methylthiotransferase accessory factor
MTRPVGATLMDMAGPYGAVGALRPINTYPWLPPEFSIHTSALNNYTIVTGDYHKDFSEVYASGRSQGEPGRAQLLAVSEALERYASYVPDEDALLTATAAELGDDAMDLDTVARCSARELRHPGCPLRLPDKAQPIRWYEAVDLHSGRDVLVPGVMTSLGRHTLPPAERFWLRISTGVAAHVSAEAATLNAIYELIERDANALIWLQRLALPRLAPQCIPPAAQEVIEWCARRGVETHVFDATTDVGVPTVYCVQTVDDPAVGRPAQYVACATEFDVSEAAEHAMYEVAGLPVVMTDRSSAPRKYADYTKITDGADEMGRPSRRSAFGFLLDDPSRRPVSAPPPAEPATLAQKLASVLRRLGELDMSVFAVDLSTRELDDAGLVAIRVIIPQLQPMSLQPLAQYRAHPRLYQAPAAMGMRVLPESRLNPYPQPMA